MWLFGFVAGSAFDTLAKVLHPADGPAADSLEATMQLMSGDQSGPVVELEGPLLSDSHIPFKVRVKAADPRTEQTPRSKLTLNYCHHRFDVGTDSIIIC